MSEYSSDFKPEFEYPYRFRAFDDLNRLISILKKKQLEVVTDPDDLNAINEGWYLIKFTEKKFPLDLPIIGSDSVALDWVTYPNENDPLIELSFEAFSKGLPITENDVTGFPINGYTAFFGPELEPFIIHNNQLEIFTNQPLGEQIAELRGKLLPTDEECKGLVNLVSLNIDEVSDRISD
jgi:hypothetical protein